MHARGGWVPIALAVALGASGRAWADPKPTPVDSKPFRAQLIVLQDAQGGTYVVQPGSDGRVFYGTGKTLYEQVVVTRFSDGTTGRWDVGVWAPRVPELRPGTIARRDNGTYHRYCGNEDGTDLELTERTGDQAKQILDHAQLMTTAMIRAPRLLARDDAGVYYYVDEIRKQYGGKGYRVFVGKKGAMKQLPLVDLATDSAGDVFSTKSGELRLVKDNEPKASATWVRGGKHEPLTVLDPDLNSPLIFRDLGVYGFVGTICEDL